MLAVYLRKSYADKMSN